MVHFILYKMMARYCYQYLCRGNSDLILILCTLTEVCKNGINRSLRSVLLLEHM